MSGPTDEEYKNALPPMFDVGWTKEFVQVTAKKAEQNLKSDREKQLRKQCLTVMEWVYTLHAHVSGSMSTTMAFNTQTHFLNPDDAEVFGSKKIVEKQRTDF